MAEGGGGDENNGWGEELQQAAVITTAATDHPREGEKLWGNARTECSETSRKRN